MLVAQNEHIKAGQKLMTFDIEKIKKAGYSDTVVVLVTNADDYQNINCENGKCSVGNKLISLK